MQETKLSTIIPLEYVKQNKKLQKLVLNEYPGINSIEEWFEHNEKLDGLFPIKIADIIDNAEKLFGDDKCCSICNEPHKTLPKKTRYTHTCNTVYTKHKNVTMTIIFKLWDKKSIKEVSEYIIKNIK